MKLSQFKLSHRFAIMISLFVAGFIIFGAWSFKTIDDLKVNGPLYQRIVQGKDLIADILPPPEYILESYLVSLQLAAASDKPEQDALVTRLTTLKTDYDTRHAFWLKENLETELDDVFLKQAHAPVLRFYATAFDALAPAVRKADAPATAAALAQMKTDYELHRKLIDQAVQITTRRTEADEALAKRQIRGDLLLMLGILIASVGAGVTAAVLIIRGVVRSIGGEPEYATSMTQLMAGGDLRSEIALDDRRGGSLLGAIKSMQDRKSVV